MQSHPTICSNCDNPILEADAGVRTIGESLVCGACIAEFYLQFVSEQKCLACGGDILLLGNGQWSCLGDECKACSPEFSDLRNLKPLTRFFATVIKHVDPSGKLARSFKNPNLLESFASTRRTCYSENEIASAISWVRNFPSAPNQTAMRALNVSAATFYRMLKDEKLKPYIKKGFVYTAQLRNILDRAEATRKK